MKNSKESEVLIASRNDVFNKIILCRKGGQTKIDAEYFEWVINRLNESSIHINGAITFFVEKIKQSKDHIKCIHGDLKDYSNSITFFQTLISKLMIREDTHTMDNDKHSITLDKIPTVKIHDANKTPPSSIKVEIELTPEQYTRFMKVEVPSDIEVSVTPQTKTSDIEVIIKKESEENGEKSVSKLVTQCKTAWKTYFCTSNKMYSADWVLIAEIVEGHNLIIK